MILTRSLDAPIVGHDVQAHRVTVQLCRWNEPRDVRDPGGLQYREAYAVDSLELAPDISVAREHFGALIGRVDPATYDATGDGPTVDLILSRSTTATDAMADIETGVIRSVSMEVEPLTETVTDGVTVRTRARLHGVALAFRPAHDAPILATREQHHQQGETTMTTDTDTDTVVSVPTHVTTDILTRSLDELRDDLTRTMIVERADVPSPSAGLMYRSFGEYAEAVWSDPANPILRRALADQVTTNNPGVIPPGWLSTVYGIVDAGAPTITAFGREALPDTGMDVNWPYFAGDLLTLIGEQLTEKTAITSVRVDLLKGTQPIRSFGGGSDVSYQLIRRSGPAYLANYLRIMTAAYTAFTDSVAATAFTAAATASAATWAPLTGTLEQLATALFTASAEVQTATGSPATFALAATDVWMAAGGAAVVASAPYGNLNVAGTASAANLQVNVAGLPVIHDPYLAAGTLLVSNGEAGTWFNEGPFTVTVEDVERLGQNVAVWGMGAAAPITPAGIRKIGAGGVTTRGGGKS